MRQQFADAAVPTEIRETCGASDRQASFRDESVEDDLPFLVI
jgi:hypothetical protein